MLLRAGNPEWKKVLTIEQIAARLDRRLSLLTGGSRTALPRHQTLLAAIDWSYNLLTEPEKTLFRRLSAFTGGWTLEAAESVCSGEGVDRTSVLELLSGLVDKSLVLTEERDGQYRYRFMVTLLEYAHERLIQAGEGDSIHRRHAEFFAGVAAEGESKLIGTEQKPWLERLTAEYDNVRSVLNWASAHDVELGLRLAGALGRFWYIRAEFVSARALLEEALAVSREAGDKRGTAVALVNRGELARRLGDHAEARALIGEGLAIAKDLGDKTSIPIALIGLSTIARQQGDFVGARALLEEALQVSRELGDKRTIAESLLALGVVAEHCKEYATARSLFEESVLIWRGLGAKSEMAVSLNGLGRVTARQGDHAAALSLHEEGVAICRRSGAKDGIAQSLNGLADLARMQADHALALSLYKQSLALWWELGRVCGEQPKR